LQRQWSRQPDAGCRAALAMNAMAMSVACMSGLPRAVKPKAG
jgi:hypothetical protein